MGRCFSYKSDREEVISFYLDNLDVLEDKLNSVLWAIANEMGVIPDKIVELLSVLDIQGEIE